MSLKTECHNFPGGLNKDGYGQTTFEGRQVGAHRLMFYLWYGWWPPVVRHTCDNRACIEPSHLEAGSVGDNNRDTVERGRRSRPLNADMPTGTREYNRERERRRSAGTWIYRKQEAPDE